MKRLFMMMALLTGLLLVAANLTMAQGKCATSMKEEAWKNCWIKEAKSGNKDLRGAYLANADLKNVDLSNADLSKAQMVNADFSGANFSGANLTGANLAGTNFTGANFSMANLTNVGFLFNNLTNADFTEANIGKTTFGDTKIGGAKLDLTSLECKVTTKGGSINSENSNGKIHGSLKNGTIVYKNHGSWDNGRINVSERRGDELVGVGLLDGKFLKCQNGESNSSIRIPKVATKVPQFTDYFVNEVYTGKNHSLVLDSFATRFRTRLNNAIKNGKPTFGGKYIVAGWGCGSGGCNTGAIIDASNGRAYPFPVSLSSVTVEDSNGEFRDYQEHIYKLNSRLMIFAGNLEGSNHTDGSDVIEFYEFRDGKFIFWQSKPYGKTK